MSECWYVLQSLDIGWVFVVDVSTTRQVLCLYIGWCWPIVVLHMADVIAILFVADVIATVMYFIGSCYCHILVGWCYCHSWYVTRLVADVIATVAVVVATCGNDVSFYGRYYCHLCWLMLLPCLCVAVFCGRCYCHYGWWYCHLWEWCDWQMLFAMVADGIACQGGCVVRCYSHMWQME